MRRFRNDHTLSSRHRLLEPSHIVIPNLFRDLYFDPLGGRWTVDGQPSLQQRSTYFSKRPAALKRACFGIFVLILSEDGGPLTVNVIFTAFSGFRFLNVQRFFGRDPVQEHYGMTEEEFVGADSTGCQYYSLHVILTMLLVRISVFAVFSRPDPVQKHHGMTERRAVKDLGLGLSEGRVHDLGRGTKDGS